MSFSVCVNVTSVTIDKRLSEVHSQDMAVARDKFFSLYTSYNRSTFIVTNNIIIYVSHF
jgi:hypothetical protein